MKNKKISEMDNIEFVSHLMAFGSPMKQVVVLHALGNYVDNVVKNEEKVIKEMEGSMIYGPAWVSACKEMKKLLDERNVSPNDVESTDAK